MFRYDPVFPGPFSLAQYLAALPADRRAALSVVRKTINENLPDGYEEGMQFGMIGWYVPLSVYPAGYGENPKVPLPLVALASQKSGMVLHFLCFYGHPTLSTWFTSEYKKSGKKLDMGKGCVRFKSLEDLAQRRGRPHRCERVRGGAHGQLPGGEGALGQEKLRKGSRAEQQRKEGRQEGETKEVTLATAHQLLNS